MEQEEQGATTGVSTPTGPSGVAAGSGLRPLLDEVMGSVAMLLPRQGCQEQHVKQPLFFPAELTSQVANATRSPSPATQWPCRHHPTSNTSQGNPSATDLISDRLIFCGLGLWQAVAPRTVTLTLPAQPPVQVLVVCKQTLKGTGDLAMERAPVANSFGK